MNTAAIVISLLSIALNVIVLVAYLRGETN
jgi:hypothetical protein